MQAQGPMNNPLDGRHMTENRNGGRAIAAGPWQVIQKQRRGRKGPELRRGKQLMDINGSAFKTGSCFAYLSYEEAETSGARK